MLNIRTKAVRAVLSFQLHDASDEPLFNEDGTPCLATVFGPGSKEYVVAQQAKTDKLMGKVMKGKEPKLSGVEQARSQAEFLAAITQSIDVAYDDLQGHEKHLAIYSDPAIGFVSEQVTAKVNDWGNFNGGPKKS